MKKHVVAGLWGGGHGHDGTAAGSAGPQQSGAALPVPDPIHCCYRSASCTTSSWSMAGSATGTQPLPIEAALPPGPGFGSSTAELGAGSIAAPPHPDTTANELAVLGIGAAGGHDHPIALLVSVLGAGAGLPGAGGRHHRGGGAVAPEHQVPGHQDQRRGAAALGVVPFTASRYSSAVLSVCRFTAPPCSRADSGTAAE